MLHLNDSNRLNALRKNWVGCFKREADLSERMNEIVSRRQTFSVSSHYFLTRFAILEDETVRFLKPFALLLLDTVSDVSQFPTMRTLIAPRLTLLQGFFSG
jgi:hypothetical protein